MVSLVTWLRYCTVYHFPFRQFLLEMAHYVHPIFKELNSGFPPQRQCCQKMCERAETTQPALINISKAMRLIPFTE